MRVRDIAPTVAMLGVAGLFVALYQWSPDGDTRASMPAGPAFQQPPTAFDSPWELVDAIAEGAFARRAGIREELRAARPLPDPLRVGFVSGTEVPAAQREALEAFAAEIEARPSISLRVIGCSDPPGSEALNLRISEQRARSVAAALERLGVSEERFVTVVGRGESCEPPERAVRVVPIRSEDAVAQTASPAMREG